MQALLKEKIKESLSSVLPITVINFVAIRMRNQENMGLFSA